MNTKLLTYELRKGTCGTHQHECYWLYFQNEPMNQYVLLENLDDVVNMYENRGYQIVFANY
jgi:hypothetical protein